MKESRPAFWKQRTLGLILALLGFLFGTSFGESGFCLGDRVFSLLGLSVWSGQTGGLHYSAFWGLCIMMAGLGLWAFFPKNQPAAQKLQAFAFLAPSSFFRWRLDGTLTKRPFEGVCLPALADGSFAVGLGSAN